MYYDVAGSLPLELLVRVVEYLDLEDIIRRQRVSKRWRTILSCDTIITPYLRETLAFLGLDLNGASTDAANADAMSYFRWRHGLERAQPVKKIFLPWPTHFANLGSGRVHCRSRRLCYNIPVSNKAVVLDLETGKRNQRWQPADSL
ncbi:hypothetical protein VTN49DRAFT_7957 [Thermomyces lanuginosus]|uniref:uncharacterized protein n=1 Tax=Thermomyces lanuginosus TaxID=5541 RepID=UPI0037421073